MTASRWPVRAALAAVVVGSALRMVALDRLPGINADEAWYGVNVHALLNGETPFLRTGIGNPLSPFHSGMLLLLSLVWAPSFTLLRVPAVLSGILTMLLAYPLLSRPLGERAAAYTTMFIAVSPLAVAYSRFGWDPSGTVLFSLLAIAAVVRDRPMLATVSVACAFLAHPTNAFLVPIVASVWAPHALERYRAQSVRLRRRVWLVVLAAVLVFIPIVWWQLRAAAANPNTALPSIAMLFDRLVSPGSWLALSAAVLRLFSGVSTVAFIGGPFSMTIQNAVSVAVGVGAFALPLLFGWSAAWSSRRRPAAWLLAGVSASGVAFHLVAGPAALWPTRERYGQFFLIPLIVIAALALDALAKTRARLAGTLVVVLCLGFLTIIAAGYFAPLALRGAESERAFRTGAAEPKAAAFQFIQRDAQPAELVEIVADDWWMYWPLRYLAGSDGRIRVELIQGASAPGGLRPSRSHAPPYARTPDRVYEVAFDHGPEWSRLAEIGFEPAFTAFDPLGRPILHVVRLDRAPPVQ